METRDLTLFAEVARLGSFAAAAKAHGVDPSSVSRTIASLEADLGVRLFQRTTRRMALTEAGDIYLGRIAPILEELERLQSDALDASAGPSGRLRLTASVAFGQTMIMPLVATFRARYPDVALECLFTDANVDLVADRIDLAIRLTAQVQGDVIASKLMDTRYRVVASPAYLASHPPLEMPKDLSQHRCVLFDLKPYRTRWMFRRAAGDVETVTVDGDVVLTPANSLREGALAGLGPALVPEWLVARDLDSGALVNPFPAHDVTATTFDTAAWFIYPSRSFLPGKVRAMIDFLRAEIAKS